LNKLPEKYGGEIIFSSPKIGVAGGDDSIFQRFKEVVGHEHYTPLELWRECKQNKISPSKLRIVSIVFPYATKIREESIKNQIILPRMKLPAYIYSIARNYANEFKRYIMNQTIDFFEKRGFNALAGILNNTYTTIIKGRFYSTWSERHIAFAAGLGTFSLHEGLITEVGCNIRLASVITNAPLEITLRKSDEPYANCLYYSKNMCKECISKCPAHAITEQGHDKLKCSIYQSKIAIKIIPQLKSFLKPFSRRINWNDRQDTYPVGCAFCQFGVPCMDKIPKTKDNSE